MKKTISILACLAVFFACVLLSCTDDEEKVKVFKIEDSALQQDFLQAGSSAYIAVNTNLSDAEWSLQSDASWCRAVKNSQNNRTVILLETDANKDTYIRTATVRVQSPVVNYEIKVRQLGYGAAILIDRQAFSFGAVGGEMSFVVTSNVDVEIIAPDWITENTSSSTRANEMIPHQYKYTVHGNTSGEARQTNLEVKEKQPAGVTDEPETALVTVTQKGLGEYEPEDPSDQLKDDVKLKVVSGTASSYNSASESIEKSFDGNLSTIYHSKYSDHTFPFTLTYNLEAANDVDYIVYYPRSDGGTNGNFKEVEIQYSATGNDPFTTLKTVDCGGSNSPTIIMFDYTVNAKSFRFVVKSGTGDYASCAEMEFYQRNSEAFDYSTLFADETCSELKPGITETEIEACKYPFFKNIAYYMYAGTYPREFRIADYKAWPNPDIQADINRTAAYSLLDNPTGISVKDGETLVVMVGDTQGRAISLRTQNYEPPTGQLDGWSYSRTYPLKRGVNKLTMTNDGLAYIMYHTSTVEDADIAPPVRIHIATGTVNGYFDTQNPTHTGRWTELLNKASYRYFDLVGERVHMTFETSAYKQYTGTKGKELADLLDKVVYSEQLLLGVYKYGNVFRNRLYMHVMYNTAVLYAASYHTAFHMNAQSYLLNPDAFPPECWGPAHEIGHVHQTRPGFRWHGMTEVTNNVMSLYIQTSILGQTSRLQSGNTYLPAAQELFPADAKTYCECTDLFKQLVPYWQLELYFGNVLGETPLTRGDGDGFYPKVYEYARKKDYTDMSNGDLQLDFVYNCCLASGKNLLDFFGKWGFLKPVNHTEQDYSEGTIAVTQTMVDELKAKVNALGYPAPDAHLEYITDNTVSLYKSKPPITAGTVSKSGSTVTLSNWKNVAAFEVCDSSDKIVSVSSGSTTGFSLSTGGKLYAVPYSGARQQVAAN